MKPKNTVYFKNITGWMERIKSRYLYTLAAHKTFLELDRAKTISYSGKNLAYKNVDILKKYSYYFLTSKEGIRYYLIIELAKFFEVDTKGDSLTLDHLLKYTETNLRFLSKDYFKEYHKEREFLQKDIDRLDEITLIEINNFKNRISKNKEKIQRIKNYRDKYIAHDQLKKKTYLVNTRDITTLLNLVRDIINFYYKKLEWASILYENFEKEPVIHTKKIFTDLRRYNVIEKENINKKWGLID